MANQTTQLTLTLNTGPNADVEELEKVSRQLWEELLELNVVTIDFARTGEIPVKAKSGGPITWGTLLLTLAASGGVLTTLINMLQSWLTRHDQRSLTLDIDGDKLEITGISSEEQKRLIDAWLSRHRGIVIAND